MSLLGKSLGIRSVSAKYAKRKAYYKALYARNRKKFHDAYIAKKEERMARGICTNCSGEAKEGCVQCETCLLKRKAKRENLVANNICIRCMTRELVAGTTTCEYCKGRDESSKYKLREERRANGLCSKCDKKAIVGSTSYLCTHHWYEKRASASLGSVKKYTELVNLFKRQHGRCIYTGIELKLGINAELDHIVAKTKGGKDEIENLQWVYEPINYMKDNHSEEEFLELIRMVAKHRGLI